MPRLGLALSGGGFRATLYHLGVIRYLEDAGQLQGCDRHRLGLRRQHSWRLIWCLTGTATAAMTIGSPRPQRRSCGSSSTTFAIASSVACPCSCRCVSWRSSARRQARNLTPNAILEHYYRKFLYGDRCLYELPEQPMLHILTTNVSNGGLSVFNRNGLFIQQRQRQRRARVPAHSRATGEPAESRRCVIGVSWFFPAGRDYRGRPGGARGAVPDRMVHRWRRLRQPQHSRVFLVKASGCQVRSNPGQRCRQAVSNLERSALGVFGQSVRATDILWDRVWQLERENFGQQPGFVFLPITKIVDLSDGPDGHASGRAGRSAVDPNGPRSFFRCRDQRAGAARLRGGS